MHDAPGQRPIDVLASLVGGWRGRGVVALPSIPSREYEEEVRFTSRSETSVDYWQRAVDREDGSMLHSESGIWRLVEGRFEVSVALPGATEVSEGSLTDRAIVLRSTSVGRASAGAPLVGTTRRYEFKAGAIFYEIQIATDRWATFGHLTGELHRRH